MKGALAARLVLPAVLLSGVLAACGTTVPQVSTLAGGQAATTQGDGLSPVASGAGGSAAAAPGAVQPDPATGTTTGATGGAASGDGTSGVGATTSQRTVPAGGAPVVPGSSGSTGSPAVSTGKNKAGTTVTATGKPAAKASTKATVATKAPTVPAGPATLSPIQVGIAVQDTSQANSVSSGVGAGLADADDKAMFTALIANLNTNGGILGHKVTAVYHTTGSGTRDTEGSSACSDFTQDNHVFAVLGMNIGTNYTTCLANAGVPFISGDQSEVGEPDFAKSPTLIMPDAIALDRLATLEVGQFQSMGYFTGTGSGVTASAAKVGLLYFDEPAFVQAEGVLKQALTAKGIKVVDEVSIHTPQGTSDLAQTEAQVQSAELKFATDGVDHVLSVETNAYIIGFFGIYAATQGYYPRYGYTSENVLSNVAANVPVKELANSLFVGWDPAQDITDTTQYPAPEQACLAFATKASQPTSTGNQRKQEVSDCEAVDYFAAALAKGGAPFSAQSLVAGSKALGTSYIPAGTFAVHLPNGGGDGASSIRQGKWDDGCSCFAYTGAPAAIS